MISTPLPTSNSTQQRRPHGGLSAAVVLLWVEGVSARLSGNALAGIVSTITGQREFDRFTQSGWCRRDHAPI